MIPGPTSVLLLEVGHLRPGLPDDALTTGDPTGTLHSLQHRWHARNLAMAGRIARACALVQRGRLVVMVGASHLAAIRRALDQHPGPLRVITAADLG